MKERNILIIKNSWSYLITHADKVNDVFYGKLSELDPTLNALLGSDMERHDKRLMDLITFLVCKLQQMPEIVKELDRLALSQAEYFSDAAHCLTLWKSLVCTLQTNLGDIWNEETGTAWWELYAVLAPSITGLGYEWPCNNPTK